MEKAKPPGHTLKSWKKMTLFPKITVILTIFRVLTQELRNLS